MTYDVYAGLPRRFQVGPHVWRIAVVAPSHPMLVGCDGLAVFAEYKIYLDKTLSLSRAVEVVTHELSHAINHNGNVGDDSTEENFVTVHSAGQVELFMRHARLHDWHTRSIRRMRREAKR